MLKIFRFILFIFIFVVIFGIFSVKVSDPDFWWHLKTGEYIYRTGSLPQTDPITYSVDKFTGRLIPLVSALLNDTEWKLIYMDRNSLIFLKDSPENAETLKKFELPKELLWNEVIVESDMKGRKVDPATLRAALSRINSLGSMTH